MSHSTGKCKHQWAPGARGMEAPLLGLVIPATGDLTSPPSINSQMLKMTCKRQAHWVKLDEGRKINQKKNWKVEQSKAPRVAVGSMSIPAALPTMRPAECFSSRGSAKTHVHHHGSRHPITHGFPSFHLEGKQAAYRRFLLQESLQTQDTFWISVL